MSRRKKKDSVTRTVVAVVLDKSGSMWEREKATIEGYNEYVTGLKKDAEGEVLLTLTQFDTEVTDTYTSVPITEVKDLTAKTYRPGGATALRDAVGRCISHTESAVRDDDKVLVVIMTDGQENSSREYSHQAVLDLMAKKREDGWEFIFLGAGEGAWAAGASLGFTKVNSYNYTGDAEDQQVVLADVATASSYVTRGMTAESYLSVSPVKKRLEDKAQSVKIRHK